MIDSSPRFRRHLPDIGELCLRPLQVDAHAAVAHRWLSSDHAYYWGMQSLSAADVRDYFTQLAASDAGDAFIGLRDGEPAFLMERYDPAAEAIGKHYDVQPGDVGMHVLVAPTDQPIAGFTWSVFTLIMDFLFSDPATARVVVEPDASNDAIHALNRRAGFVYHRQVELPDKIAWFATCTRNDYETALTPRAPERSPTGARA